MSVPGGIEDHPDLRDQKWIKQATRRAKREIRKNRRRARLRARTGMIVTVVSLLVIGGVLAGLYRAGEIKFGLPDDPLPQIGVNLTEPFKGTPAQDWANGEAGITAPDANPEFAPVYEQVKKALVAARLDGKMLNDRDPGPMLALLDPKTHDWARKWLSSISTQIEPGQRLLPVAPKVSGRMWAEKNAEGQIVVHTSYRFAYAFHTDSPQSVTDQNGIVAMERADADYTRTDGGLWITEVHGFQYSMSCKAAEAGYLGPSYKDPRLGGGDFDEKKWYAADAPMPTEDGCKK